jgi:hypothetical protein
MRRQLAIAMLAASVLLVSAQAQVRSPGPPRTGGVIRFGGTPQISGPNLDVRGNPIRGHFPRVGGGGGVQIGIGFGNPRGHHNFGGRGFSNRCLRGCTLSGAYYPYYAPVYVGPSVILESNGPDFRDQPSAYTIGYGTGRVPAEYVAPGADAVAAAYRQGQMEQRITSLADEVARLRAEKEARDREGIRRDPRGIGESFANTGTLDANTPSAGPANAATATLVFRNGHRLDVANYAVVGQTLWVFDEQRARRVPLAELNLDATRKANAENGFELKLPAQK